MRLVMAVVTAGYGQPAWPGGGAEGMGCLTGYPASRGLVVEVSKGVSVSVSLKVHGPHMVLGSFVSHVCNDVSRILLLLK